VLNFDIPEGEDSDLESARHTKSGKMAKASSTRVAVHAIPIFDGKLISQESDIIENIIEFGEMNVELLNDFEIPWVCRKNTPYPKYRRVKRKKSNNDGSEGEGDEDQDFSDEDRDVGSAEEDEEEES